MSKILKSFGLAALLVALLAGTGMAATSNAIVTGDVTEADLSFDVAPAGGTFAALKCWDSPATDDDTTTITTNCPWQLAVIDQNAGTDSGYMREYDSGYVVPGEALTEKLAVNVEGIGDNGGLPVTITLTDADDLSASDTLAVSTEASTAVDLDMEYSQEVDCGDVEATYRMDITYTLSVNV